MHITFCFQILKLALLKNIKHKSPECYFTKQFRNQCFQGLRIFLNTMTFKVHRTYGKCALLYEVVVPCIYPHNIPAQHNPFKWAFSDFRGQRNLTGSLLANSTHETKTTFTLTSPLVFSLQKIQMSFTFREIMS